MQNSTTLTPASDIEARRSNTEAASQLPLLDVLSPLWTRWRLLGLVFVATLAIALCLSPFVQQRYSSEAVLILDRASSDIATFDTPLTNLVIDSEAVASEIEILYSTKLATSIVESEGLLGTREFNPEDETSDDMARAAVRQFLRQLDVQRKGISRAIVVKFTSIDAKRAANVVNAIVARYLNREMERKIEQESIASNLLSEEIDALEKRIADSEVRIADYRQQVGQSGTGDESQREKNIAGLNAQRVLAQAESSAADALLQQARSLTDNPAAFAALPSSDISPALQRLRGNELDLQTSLDQLALTYGDKHPRVLQVQSQLSRTRRDIRTEIEKSLQVLEGTAESALRRVAALSAEMQGLERAESGTWSLRAQLLALERERESDIERLGFYSTRLRELSQSSSIENLQPFARVISAGQISDNAEFPDRRALLLLLPALVTLGLLGFLVISGLLRKFTLGHLPSLPGNASWFGRIPTASLFYRLPFTTRPYADQRLKAAVQKLCHSLDLALTGTGRVVMFTGLRQGDGTSTVAIAVAQRFANTGKPSLLVDLDMRRPARPSNAHVLNASDLLASRDIAQASLNKALQRDTRTKLYRLVLHWDPTTESDAASVQPLRDLAIENFLSGSTLKLLLSTLSGRFSRVVLNLPPVLEAPDSAVVAQQADLSLIVATPASLSRESSALYRGIERLQNRNNAVLGVVLNRMDADMNTATSMSYVASDHHYANVTDVSPATVEKSDKLMVAAGGASESMTREAESTSVMPMTSTRLRGESWLLRQPAQFFTLYLLTTLSRPNCTNSLPGEAVDLPLACYMRRNPEGKAEYVLLLGLFNSHQSAREALEQLVVDPLPYNTAVLSLSSVHRDIFKYRSAALRNRGARSEKHVA